MKKLLLVAAVVVATVIASGAGSANAVTWPTHCHSWRCVNSHLNNLNNRVKTLRQAVFQCEAIVPITQYEDFELAGDADPDGAATSGLDITADGGTVDAWFVIDQCETSTTPRPLPSGTGLTPRRVGD